MSNNIPPSHAKAWEETNDYFLSLYDENDKVRLQELASYLHNAFCTGNHADYCGWFYEGKGRPSLGQFVDNWDGNAHKAWLDKAKRLLEWQEK